MLAGSKSQKETATWRHGVARPGKMIVQTRCQLFGRVPFSDCSEGIRPAGVTGLDDYIVTTERVHTRVPLERGFRNRKHSAANVVTLYWL